MTELLYILSKSYSEIINVHRFHACSLIEFHLIEQKKDHFLQSSSSKS